MAMPRVVEPLSAILARSISDGAHGLRARAAIRAQPLRQAHIAIPVLALSYIGPRARYCVPTTNRQRTTPRTIVLPGTPREARSGTALPARKEAAARPSSVVTHFPASSNDHAARATLGRQGASQKAGVPGSRVRVRTRVSVPGTQLCSRRTKLDARHRTEFS